MSIQTEIERIQSAVALAQNAVKERGGVLASGSGTALERLAKDIQSIPNGLSAAVFIGSMQCKLYNASQYSTSIVVCTETSGSPVFAVNALKVFGNSGAKVLGFVAVKNGNSSSCSYFTLLKDNSVRFFDSVGSTNSVSGTWHLNSDTLEILVTVPVAIPSLISVNASMGTIIMYKD